MIKLEVLLLYDGSSRLYYDRFFFFFRKSGRPGRGAGRFLKQTFTSLSVFITSRDEFQIRHLLGFHHFQKQTTKDEDFAYPSFFFFLFPFFLMMVGLYQVQYWNFKRGLFFELSSFYFFLTRKIVIKTNFLFWIKIYILKHEGPVRWDDMGKERKKLLIGKRT